MKKLKKNKGPFRKYIDKLYSVIMMPEMNFLPGQLAFYMLLSLVPILTLACYVANLFEFDYLNIISLVSQFVPGGIDFINPFIETGNVTFPMIVLFIWMLYIASNGCNALILISNEIYGIPQSSWLKRRIKALFMLLMIIVFAIGLLLLSIYQYKLMNLVLSLNNGDQIYNYLIWLRYPISFLILFIFIRIIYKFAPDRIAGKKHVTAGTIITSVGWIVLTAIYGNVSRHMFTYEVVYGALAHVAVLMVWLYFMSYVFVMGLAINCSNEIEEENN